MISVLLPTYNEPIELICKSIKSIQGQTYVNIEILIIVDNPKRADLIEKLKEIKRSDNRIRIIINDKNIGLTASLNKAVSLSKGYYIARMDADDISLPTRLEKQLSYLKNNKYDLVGCYIAHIDSSEKITRSKVTFPRGREEIRKMLRFNSAIPHPTWLGKAELFHRFQYIDYPACEDYELLARLSINNIKMGNVPEVLFWYRDNNNGISSNKKALQKTGLSYIRKNYRKNKISNLDDYLKFLNTKKAKKIIKHNNSYYLFLKNIKSNKRKIGKLKILLRSLPRLLNKTAAENIYCTFHTRSIRRIEKGAK